jgi:hypothetical protein
MDDKAHSPTLSGAPALARSLTLWHATLYGWGVTIGAGIYGVIGVAAARRYAWHLRLIVGGIVHGTCLPVSCGGRDLLATGPPQLRFKKRSPQMPPGIYQAPCWVPWAGAGTGLMLLATDAATELSA